MEKDTGSFEDIARNKLAQAIDDLESADILLGADKYRVRQRWHISGILCVVSVSHPCLTM